MNTLKVTLEKQDAQIIALEDDIAEKKIILSQEKDRDYYERRARELNYHFNDEIIFYNDFSNK